MSITYDDILAKMGMYVQDGQLVKSVPVSSIHAPKSIPVQQQQQHSYIYNKHFKEYIQPEPIQRPQDPIELRNQMLRDFIHKKKMEQIKTRQISYQNPWEPTIVPFPSYTNVNRLFTFAKK